MKKFNLAALPLAVAGVLASTSAFAGTEACFEVYTGTDNAVAQAFGVTYDLAACGARTGDNIGTVAAPVIAGPADDVILAKNDVVSIAYELTGVDPVSGEKVFDLSYDDIDATGAVTGKDQVIVYIPTTDIPGGTLIEMKLSGSGAEFSGNGNQIHLVKDSNGATVGDAFEAVASSDGTLDGTDTVTFITKAGVTIGAGTRLVFSRNSTGADMTEFLPVGIKLGNAACTTASSSSSVTLSVTRAKTDGGTGYEIEGAKTKTAQLISEIAPQFYALQDGSTAEAQVNAESTDSSGAAVVARTQFVYNPVLANQLVVKKQEVAYKTAFYDRGRQGPVAGLIVDETLDQFITLGADDHLKTKFVASSAPGSEVEMALYNDQVTANGTHVTQEEVEDSVTWGEFGLSELAATTYETEAIDVFTPVVGVGAAAETNPAAVGTALEGANYNEMWYVLTNERSANTGDEIMNFNYVVDTHYTLDFDDPNLLDHCAQEKKTHEIGVNGAVLKVPYTTTASGNFVRITNEHDESAEVTFDMFGESLDGTVEKRKVTAVALGTVPAQSSVVYFMNDVLEAAEAAGYLGADGGYAEGDLGSNFKSADNRHTVTFTVTAPRDSVHGVAVQKVIGSVADRVMPVLDQNAWSQ
ncbi:hypothetical protein [Litorilituus sediminis]|uniref:Uncharacterized protein n=1 Tax=Litorilituus sediminis TaxID=718192 RepID=A0A4P6P5A8_9GAMM|nr:hypothetical protein [Litorilituus sediminis]QBG35309.1 hypothetical protein EMK97_06030 [Litorilituus sediminis]